jgi:biopolymer transport protein ExbB
VSTVVRPESRIRKGALGAAAAWLALAVLAVVVLSTSALARQDAPRGAGAAAGLATDPPAIGTAGLSSPREADGGNAAGAPSRAATGEGEAVSEEGEESFLSWMARASGPIGLVIVVMSFYLIALVVWMALNYRPTIASPRALVRDVQGLLDQRMYTEAYHRLAADGSLLARILAAGVRKLPSGLPSAQRAMELANEDATMEMEHRTTYLATVGTLGPMIGLVGTVYGMIKAFRVIAIAGASPQASELAEGISTALFATLEGIAISIPAIYFYAMFRNRIARLSLEASLTAEPLLEQFVPGIRPNASGGAGASGSGTSPVGPAGPTVPATMPAMPRTMPMPMPTATVAPVYSSSPAAAHPHPFAVSAAIAASAPGSNSVGGSGAGPGGGASPSSETGPETGNDPSSSTAFPPSRPALPPTD